MDILRGDVLQEHAVDLGSTVDIELHPWLRYDMLNVVWDILDPATILDTQSLHARRNRKTDLIFSSRLSKVEKSIVTQRLITD